MTKRLAIFGKGGIGKSTVSSNLSAVLALLGNRVLQIGCDPKHDSTLLLTGKPIVPILMIDEHDLDDEKDDWVHKGIYGVSCVEIGGPEPGIGCAGRGILRGIEILDGAGLFEESYDVVLFDVLGDVVCGGFFAPLKQHADEMYIVTSGEFNSLFAANNLCRGYMNNALGDVVFGGIIGNCRGNPNEIKIIEQFCECTGAPLLGIVPKDAFIEQCTFECIPLIAKAPHHPATRIMRQIAGRILDNIGIKEIRCFSLDDLRDFYKTMMTPSCTTYQPTSSNRLAIVKTE